MMGVFVRRKTHREENCEDGDRDWDDVAPSQSPEDCQQLPSQERGLVKFSIRSPSRNRPCILSLLGPVTEHHSLGGFQIICLTVLEAGKAMIKAPADWVSGESPLLGPQMASCCASQSRRRQGPHL